MSFTRITGPGISSYPVITGIITALNFKTGTTNVHSVGVEAAGINILGGDTPIGTGATIFKDGSVRFGHTGNNNTGIVTANKVDAPTITATTVTATTFSGDGSNLTSLPAGLGTALSSTQTSPLNKLYYTDNVLSIGATITVDPPSSASAAYTQYTDIVVEDTADLIMGDGDDLVPDVLGLSTETATVYSATGGRIRAGTFKNAGANGAPTATNGWIVTGVSTAQTLSVTGNATISGNLGVAGTITYEDVARVDATGISTFREGFGVGPLAGIALTAYKDGSIRTSGIITASTFGSDTNSIFTTGGSERLRIHSDGKIGIGLAGGTPDGLLEVYNSSTAGNTVLKIHNDKTGDAANITLEGKRTSDNDTAQVLFKNNNYSVAAIFANAGGSGNHDGGYLKFHTSAIGSGNALSERLRITSTGNVAIGNASPQQLLHVWPDTANTTSAYVRVSSGDRGSGTGIDLGSDADGDGRLNVVSNGNLKLYTNNTERLRIGSAGQIGIAGANYGDARQVMVSNGSSAAVSWSSNPFLLDMDSLGDIDYDGVFLRYRETASVTGNGLVYLGLCKSTTNCSPGRIGIPVGFIPGTSYNSHFRVDKVGITPWPDSGGHRYEFYAIISDWASAGKLGIFYLTNSTN